VLPELEGDGSPTRLAATRRPCPSSGFPVQRDDGGRPASRGEAAYLMGGSGPADVPNGLLAASIGKGPFGPG
jgi:hypothetical protein